MSKPGKAGVFKRGQDFIQDVKNETDKVTWLNREDLRSNTQVVLVFLGILAVIIGAMDIVFQNFVLMLFRTF